VPSRYWAFDECQVGNGLLMGEFFNFLNAKLLELNIKLTEFEFLQEFENMKMPGRYWAFDG